MSDSLKLFLAVQVCILLFAAGLFGGVDSVDAQDVTRGEYEYGTFECEFVSDEHGFEAVLSGTVEEFDMWD